VICAPARREAPPGGSAVERPRPSRWAIEKASEDFNRGRDILQRYPSVGLIDVRTTVLQDGVPVPQVITLTPEQYIDTYARRHDQSAPPALRTVERSLRARHRRAQ
jgi:hypothetical protein